MIESFAMECGAWEIEMTMVAYSAAPKNVSSTLPIPILKKLKNVMAPTLVGIHVTFGLADVPHLVAVHWSIRGRIRIKPTANKVNFRGN